ncbi:MAG: hypothetical protein ABIR15_04270, partial [Chitinophagaceae bacterium]
IEGQENVFDQFEEIAIPAILKYIMSCCNTGYNRLFYRVVLSIHFSGYQNLQGDVCAVHKKRF